jgi:hypothetical protein
VEITEQSRDFRRLTRISHSVRDFPANPLALTRQGASRSSV